MKSGIHLGSNLVTHEEETISYANLLKSGPGKIKTLKAAEDFLRRYYMNLNHIRILIYYNIFVYYC